MKRLSIIVALFLLVTGCKKDKPSYDPNEPQITLSKLYGSWNWVQSSGGVWYNPTTPAKTGITRGVDFTSDGIYREYTNGKLILQTTFVLKTTNYSTGPLYTIKLAVDSAFERYTIGSTRHDTLRLGNNMIEAGADVYVRKK